jgi:hypothetical protein
MRVNGLFAMSKAVGHLSEDGNPIKRSPDPVFAFIYLLAVKADNIIRDRNQPFAFPLLQFDERYFRQWFAATHRSEDSLQVSLASAHLAFLCNNVGHLRDDAVKLRLKGERGVESMIRERVEIIRKKHYSWLFRPFVERNIKATNSANLNPTSKSDTPQFLHYPPYIVFDSRVARMHIVHSSLVIQMSIAENGKIQGFSEDVFDTAVSICRIYAIVSIKQEN